MKIKKELFFKDKKVLLVGLGILGGGRSMAEFILEEGGVLTITDLRNLEILQKEISSLDKFVQKKSFTKINYTLENHLEKDFQEADIVVFNPAVPFFSQWPRWCIKNNKEIYNDFSLFQAYLYFYYKKDLSKIPKQIWITGTRGKTTTTTWIDHLLGEKSVLGGNMLGSGLQKIVRKKTSIFVLETSNYQLEYEIERKKNNFENFYEPEIAVLTNIFTDHINRHKTFEEYKRVKSLVFSYQNENQKLFLSKSEKSLNFIFKEKILSKRIKNIDDINISEFTKKAFPSQKEISLKVAIACAKHFKVADKEIKSKINSLPSPKMRQEIIFKNKNLTVINDSAATSPDALIVALKSFLGNKTFFISGGTDAQLDFSFLIKEIKKNDLILSGKMKLLKGTATDKILSLLKINTQKELEKNKNKIVYEFLEDCMKDILLKKPSFLILSPGAKSFGLFKNEFDRGEKFNSLIKKLCK
jgi:UDP-N-acetylmuramoylalanine--D-glutamate ligase